MASIKNVVVAGGSGNLGLHIISALLACKFTVTVLSRPNSTGKFDPAVRIVSTVYTPTSLATALAQQDAIVCSLSFEAWNKQLAVIDAAVEVGVKRIVLSEYGMSREQPMTEEFAAIAATKFEVEAYARKMATENERFTWTAIAAGAFIDWALSTVPIFGFHMKKQSATIYDSGNELVSGTTIASIGKAVAATLKAPKETENRWVKVLSLQTSQNEILTSLQQQTDKTWEKTTVSTSEVAIDAKKKVAEGDFGGGLMGTLAVQLFADGGARSVVCTPDESDNELLGIPLERTGEIVKRVLSEVE